MNTMYYIKASSLLETVIAITIITLCSLVGTMVYSSIIDQTSPLLKYQYQYELDLHIQKATVLKDFSPSKKTYKGFTIEKKVTQSLYDEKIQKIIFIVTTAKDTIQYPLLTYNPTSDEI